MNETNTHEARTVVTTIGISTSDPSEGKFANGAIEKVLLLLKTIGIYQEKLLFTGKMII
jgi:hypothetical protein